MTVQIIRPGSDATALLMAGIQRKEWQTIEALDQLVTELRSGLESGT
jgi:hypothetical protein